jgi:hypothetical protein
LEAIRAQLKADFALEVEQFKSSQTNDLLKSLVDSVKQGNQKITVPQPDKLDGKVGDVFELARRVEESETAIFGSSNNSHSRNNGGNSRNGSSNGNGKSGNGKLSNTGPIRRKKSSNSNSKSTRYIKKNMKIN